MNTKVSEHDFVLGRVDSSIIRAEEPIINAVRNTRLL